MNSKSSIHNAKRIVIKVGSVLVTDDVTSLPHVPWLDSLAKDIFALQDMGKQVCVVTSGSIALGRKPLAIGTDVSSTSIPLDLKQAAASIGQIRLLEAYSDAFQGKVGQILLTPEDTENRRSHLNARATILQLLKNGFVPIINENDTTSTDEIRFGDNDRLAARVSQMIGADLLILLSTVDGLYTDDPKTNPAAEFIPVVEALTDDVFAMGRDTQDGVSTGGMISKLEAARIAVSSGASMVVGSGLGLHPIQRILQEDARSTLFLSDDKPQNARKRWIRAHLKPKGKAIVDAGAAKALHSGKSLLPIGVLSIEGRFELGDPISIVDEGGSVLGIGLSSYNAESAKKICKAKSSEIEGILGFVGREELIHRNNLVLQEN